MAGQLPTPVMSDLKAGSGDTEYTVDIGWTGQDNSVDLAQFRVRWAWLSNGASSPAPLRADFIGAAERDSDTGEAQGTFTSAVGLANANVTFSYTDRIRTAVAGDRSTSGAQTLNDVPVDHDGLANKTVWVSARQEVA